MISLDTLTSQYSKGLKKIVPIFQEKLNMQPPPVEPPFPELPEPPKVPLTFGYLTELNAKRNQPFTEYKATDRSS